MSPILSVVVPIKNEEGNIASLVRDIASNCERLSLDYEIIVVDDKSDDASLVVLKNLQRDVSSLRVLMHDRNGGQSAAVHSGVLHARGNIICTLDGDGQNPPDEIPKLVKPLLSDHAYPRIGLVAGQRIKRQDTFSKRIASRLANRIRSALLKDGTRDTGCGLKAFPKSVFLELPYFNHMHRYLPALVSRAGYRIELVDVSHRMRGSGRSNYSNIERALVGISDLLGVMWLMRRSKNARVIPDKRET